MRTLHVSPDQVSLSHAYTLLVQLFDAFDGNPPEPIESVITELFVEVCAIEGASSDGAMSLYGKMMYVGHFIAQLEAQNASEKLKNILEKIQTVLSQVKKDPILFEFLGINKIFVEAILSKTI